MAGTPFQKGVFRLAPAVAAVLAAFAASPVPAHAVSLYVRPDVAKSADVRVCLAASEPAGLGMLLVDGAVVRTVALSPSSPATIAAVPLAVGTHQLRVLVRSSSGLAATPCASVRSWAAPAAPVVSGLHDGLYPVSAPITVATGANTTKVSATLAGKGVWTKAVAGPARISYAFCLPPGASTLKFTSANPALGTSKSVTLNRAMWPTPGFTTVSSEFGMRDGRMHKGVDIPATYGSKVIAVGAGRVLWAEKLSSYGGLVMIDHGNKLTTYYAHLSRIDVKLGQWVCAGQQIGAVGTANTAHLHFQTFTGGLGWADTSDKFRRVNSGTPVDPRLYIGRP